MSYLPERFKAQAWYSESEMNAMRAERDQLREQLNYTNKCRLEAEQGMTGYAEQCKELREQLAHAHMQTENARVHRQALVDNLAMLIKRMVYRLRKHAQHVADSKLADQAEQFLQANGMISAMDILREKQMTAHNGKADTENTSDARKHSEQFKEAEQIALKIGRRCVLDDGFFDLTRTQAYIEPKLIEYAARLSELREQRDKLLVALKKIRRINCPDCDSPEIADAAIKATALPATQKEKGEASAEVGIWICTKCGFSGEEHGLAGHAAYQCTYQPIFTTRRAHNGTALPATQNEEGEK